MALIKNIGVGKFGVDSNILSTTGISSCIAAVIEFEDIVFIYHIDPSQFEKSTTGSINNGQILLMKIFDKLCRTDQQAIIKNTFLIGGWNNDFYTRLGQQIDLICNNSSLVMDYYHQFSSRNFHSFIKSIKLNLISFNLPPKSPDGKIKDVNDDDHPDDYVTDLTIICDRSYNLIIYQYGGKDKAMNSNKDMSLLLSIYIIDLRSHDIKGYLCAEKNSIYYDEFYNQMINNVKNISNVYESKSMDDNVRKKLSDLLLQVETKDIFDDM